MIDAIEFNERCRIADVAADVAFLAMELDARGHLAGTSSRSQSSGPMEPGLTHAGEARMDSAFLLTLVETSQR